MTTPLYLNVANFLRARRRRWVDGRELARVGGFYGWRTKVSNCRTVLGLTVENRKRTIRKRDGSRYIVSEYRLV